MKKESIFKITAILLPFIILFLVEIALRITKYGESYPLFHKVTVENQPDYLVMNPFIANKYFKDKNFRSDNQFDLFVRTKTDSTFRIFVQGASTTVGFPFYRGGSFPRMLKYRLSQTFPEKNIEVVNTGITAVNSYTMWDLTDEIIKQKPDLVIIYAGHNEYYGALGVGSTNSFGSHPVIIRSYLTLKKSRLFQFLDNSYTRITSDTQKPKIGETTLMEVMVREQRIPYDSKMYHAGINQFEGNLKRILKKYKNHHIPVILSTIVSNEKDVKPFISDSLINENQFIEALNQNRPEANQLAQKNALAAYTLGKYYLQINQDTAKKYLHLAKELDLLRFRAPEKINNVIVNFSKKYDYPLVDMVDIFASHSAYGIIGDELLTEHVHPNVKGYLLMADAYYHKIQELGLLGDYGENYISFDEASHDIPVTEIDSLKGKIMIDDLKKSWPYDLSMAGNRAPIPYHLGNSTYEQRRALDLFTKLAYWKDVMLQSYAKYDREGAYGKGLRVAQSLILEYPEEPKVYRLAGKMCLRLGDFEKAVYYFFKHNQLDQSSLSAQQLALVYIKLNNIELANKTLQETKNRGLNDEVLNHMIKGTMDQLSKNGIGDNEQTKNTITIKYLWEEEKAY